MRGNGKVFISHAHEDNARCTQLRDALNAWGVEYFIDLDHLHVGASIDATIQAELVQCDVFIRVCTSTLNGGQKPYVEDEAEAFRALANEDRKRGLRDKRTFICLVLDEGYQLQPFEKITLQLLAYRMSEAAWMAELRDALGVPPERGLPPLPDIDSTRPPIPPMPAPPKPPSLQRMLQEMDKALADELEKVRRSGRERTATDGAMVGRLDGQFIYTFSLEEPWEPTEDTPLSIKLQGQRKIQASVVTCTGTAITILAAEELPPDDLHSLKLMDDPTQLIEGLRKALADSDET